MSQFSTLFLVLSGGEDQNKQCYLENRVSRELPEFNVTANPKSKNHLVHLEKIETIPLAPKQDPYVQVDL